MKTETISVRIDEFTKKASEEILHKNGLSLSTAITLFLRQVIYTGTIPFEISVPKFIVDNNLNIDDLNRLFKIKNNNDLNNIKFNLIDEINKLK